MGIAVSPYPIYSSGSQYTFTDSAGVPYRRPGEDYEFTGSGGSIHQSFVYLHFSEPNSSNIMVPYSTSKEPPKFSASAYVAPRVSGTAAYYPPESSISSYYVYDGNLYDCTAGDWYNMLPDTRNGFHPYQNRTAQWNSVNILYAPFARWLPGYPWGVYKMLSAKVRVENPPYTVVSVGRAIRTNQYVSADDDELSQSSFYFMSNYTSRQKESDGKRYSYWHGDNHAFDWTTSPIETNGFWLHAYYLRAAGINAAVTPNRSTGASPSATRYNPMGFAYDFAISANSSHDTSLVHMFNGTQRVFSDVSGIVFSGSFNSGVSSDISKLGGTGHPVIFGIDTSQNITLELSWAQGAETASASSEFITASAGRTSCNFSASVFNTAGIIEFTPWVSAYPLRYGLWDTRFKYSATAR